MIGTERITEGSIITDLEGMLKLEGRQIGKKFVQKRNLMEVHTR